jgi:hypothetical protein
LKSYNIYPSTETDRVSFSLESNQVKVSFGGKPWYGKKTILWCDKYSNGAVCDLLHPKEQQAALARTFSRIIKDMFFKGEIVA